MRFFWVIFFTLIFVQKVLIPFYFFILAAFTAPGDTSDLIQKLNMVLDNISGNIALDILLLMIGAVGLIATFGWGNWRIALHRYMSKARLERLSEDARRVSEEIAHTIAQERSHRDREFEIDWSLQDGATPRRMSSAQDSRYLSKHMMEAHAVIERLKDVGYWKSSREYFQEIGIAGATSFAAEDTCKALFTASEKIRADLKDGLAVILTRPSVSSGKTNAAP